MVSSYDLKILKQNIIVFNIDKIKNDENTKYY